MSNLAETTLVFVYVAECNLVISNLISQAWKHDIVIKPLAFTIKNNHETNVNVQSSCLRTGAGHTHPSSVSVNPALEHLVLFLRQG